MNREDDRTVFWGAVLVAALLFSCVWVLTGCPPPDPKPTPSPTPVVECKCSIPPSDDPGWRGVSMPSDETPWNADAIIAARNAVGDTCGKIPEDSLKLLAVQLQAQNICAEQWADAVLAANPNGTYEQWHLIRYEDGCYYNLSNALKGVWTHPQATSCKGGVK